MYKVVEDLVADDLDHLERRVRRDRVDEHVPVDADEVLGVEDRVLVLFSERVSLPPEIPGTMSTRKRKETYLTSRIDNLRREVLSFIPDLLAERVLDGRVITFYEMPVHVAHGQRGFSCWEDLLVTCRTLGCLDALAGTGRARLLELAASARGRLAALARRSWPRTGSRSAASFHWRARPAPKKNRTRKEKKKNKLTNGARPDNSDLALLGTRRHWRGL